MGTCQSTEAPEAEVVGGAPRAGNADDIEQAKQITKEVFMAGVEKLMQVSIDGYPKALRSTMARRNELLREMNGNQDLAVEKISKMAAALSEEGKTWLLGLVPYVGLPSQLLYPTWTMMRRVCLLAAVYGLDLNTEGTRALIIQTFAGLRAVPAAEYAIEAAVQLVWIAFAGPVAGFLPVGTVVSKVANVEGHVVDAVGRENFKEKGREVPEEEYMEELDPEPTRKDYIDLAKEGTALALYSAWAGAKAAAAMAQDKGKRQEAVDQAVDQAARLKGTAAAVGTGAVALAGEKGAELAGKVADKAKGGPKPETAARPEQAEEANTTD